MPLSSHNLGELAPDDVREYFARGKDTVLIPIGSMEQHGPHLPLLADTIQAEEIAHRGAEKADVLYTPSVWMGYSPQHMYGVGCGTGTITIRPQLISEIWYDIGRCLIHHGFNRIIYVNNHGSNTKIIEPLLRRLRYDTGAFVAMSKLYGERYLALIDDVMENPANETPGWHSSELETSQVMASNPNLVHMERAVQQFPERPKWFPEGFDKSDGAPDVKFRGHEFFLIATDHGEFTPTGVIGNPFRASAEKGETTYSRYAGHLAAAIAEFETIPVQVHTREWKEIAL